MEGEAGGGGVGVDLGVSVGVEKWAATCDVGNASDCATHRHERRQ